jgi:hypothetical protein
MNEPKVKVTIVSIWSKRTAEQMPPTYDVQVPAEANEDGTLENAFAATNAEDRPNGTSVCSTSTGDIMILAGKAYLVGQCGFVEITTAEFNKAIRLTSIETGMGYKFMKENRMI